MGTELTESAAPPDSMNWLERIIEKGVIDAASLEKLIDLKQRMEDRIARQAFALAMKRCQEEMPRIVKDTKGRNGKYALLETLKDICCPIWLKHGFSISWSQGEAREGMTRVIATLYHIEGWFETYQGDYPIDGKGAQGKDVMNALQGTVSSHTYAQRDMIRLMFDITIAGADRDGNQGGGFLDSAQIKAINELIEECNELAREEPWKAVDYPRFLGWAAAPGKAESLDEVPSGKFTEAINFLNARRKMPKPQPKKAGAK